MADQRLPELAAVITPARTDIVGVRQSGDTRDKKETIAQALSLIADSDIAESNVTQHEAALTITESQISDLQAYLLPVDLTSIAAGSAAAPSLAWGDGDTGFYELADGIINFTSQGVGQFSFRTGAILPFNAAGPAILNEAATSTNPTFAPNAADLDTGLGWNAEDDLALIAGGIAGLRLKELNSGVVQAPVADVAITAFATGGQGSAVALKQSYNVISVCATAGDSVKLPLVFLVNSIVTIKNDGAESCDVFPASGDDLGQGADTAEALASGVSASYIATAANATWTLMLASAGGADPSLLGDGSAGAPTYSFASDTDMGMYLAGSLRIAVSGVDFVTMDGADFRVAGDIECVNNSGGALKNEATSATNPTALPNRADVDSGIGQGTLDQLSFIAGGVEIAQIKEVVGANQFIVAPGVIQNAPATPSLAFGDGDTGFFEFFDDRLALALGGVNFILFDGSITTMQVIGNIVAQNSAGYGLRNETASATNPTVLARNIDADSGLGSSALDAISVITGGIEALRFTELNSGIVQAPAADVTITAFATGGQGSAVTLKQSYNVVSVCATAGDSVKLPPVYAVNSIVYVKNDGAESCDVFPATNDDLGEGNNTALAVASGESATFIATTANDVWTLLLVSAAGGGADPSLLGDGTVGAPSYSFTNSPTTGFYRQAADSLGIATAGVARFEFKGDVLQSQNSSGPAMVNAAINPILPQFCPNQNDLNTGLGSPGQDEISLIAGGVEAVSYVEGSGVRILATYQTDKTLTADVGSAQGNGLVGSSYNIFSIVANAGDAATLPQTHPVGTHMWIKNDGANSMDIFPFAGDDLGQGSNTAVALAAGSTAFFITTSANFIWTQMI